MSNKIQNIINWLTKLPGIGPRQAYRLVLSLATWPKNEISEFSKAVDAIKDGHVFCSQCGNFADGDLCSICLNPKRNRNLIVVVEKIPDLIAMEKAGANKGSYHVLGGSVNPAVGITPESLRIKELLFRVDKLKSKPETEIVLATNPTTSGETTALYIEDSLRESGVKVTRLARGLPSGSYLEYADEITITHAISNRK